MKYSPLHQAYKAIVDTERRLTREGIEPSRTQTKQIVDGLQRCHHPDSQHEFLRAWIRDWTIHKTAPREWVGLTDEEISYQARKEDHAVYFALGALWAEAKLKEKNT